MSNLPAWFVVVMGVGTVFAGLICIVLICTVMGWIFSFANKKKSIAPATQNASLPKEEQNSVIAAISAAIAEENGTVPQGIRIVSIRRV